MSGRSSGTYFTIYVIFNLICNVDYNQGLTLQNFGIPLKENTDYAAMKNSRYATRPTVGQQQDFLAKNVLEAWKEGHQEESMANNEEASKALNSTKSVSEQLQTDEFLLCKITPEQKEEIHSFQDQVDDIVDLFTKGSFRGKTYELLANVTDMFGPRMTGTSTLENAIDWVIDQSTKEGFVVYTENVTAPHWVRNTESLEMKTPRVQKLNVLGLGQTVGTELEGVTAEALVVSSFQELLYLKSIAMGKIIVYDPPFKSYPETIVYRVNGAVEAAKVGGVAALVRSVTDFSIDSPHAGSLVYETDVKKIPAASITVEDAAMLHRIQDRGQKIILKLQLGAENLPDTISRNTIIELTGTKSPEEIVLLSGHFDSWDVGNGVMDDAGGCIIAWMAGKSIKSLNLKPRRTLRSVLFTGEEQGIYGGEAYYKAHVEEKDNFQLMMESDAGLFDPLGLSFSGSHQANCIMKEILSLTKEIGTTQLLSPADTPDLEYFQNTGVPLGSLYSQNDRYFWFHHSNGDHIEVYDPVILDKVSALWTAVAYVSAQMSFRIPHQEMSRGTIAPVVPN